MADATQGSERCAGPGRRSPGENSVRRPHEAGAPLRCSLSPPRCSPLVKVRSPPSDSHRSAPPKRPSPCGCCTDESVLCTRAVATRATLGCSRVARLRALARQPPEGRCPRREATGERRAGTRPKTGVRRRATRRRWPASDSPARECDPASHAGHQAADVPRSVQGGLPLPRRPGTHALGWRVAPNSGPRIPHDTNPGGLPLHRGRNKVQLQLTDHPASPGGDRTAGVFLLHPAPAAQGSGGPAGPGFGVRGRRRGADRRRRHRHRARGPRRPLHALDGCPGRRRQPRRPPADPNRLRPPGHRQEDRADRRRADRRRAGSGREAGAAGQHRQRHSDATSANGSAGHDGDIDDVGGDGAASSGDLGGEAEEG